MWKSPSLKLVLVFALLALAGGVLGLVSGPGVMDIVAGGLALAGFLGALFLILRKPYRHEDAPLDPPT